MCPTTCSPARIPAEVLPARRSIGCAPTLAALRSRPVSVIWSNWSAKESLWCACCRRYSPIHTSSDAPSRSWSRTGWKRRPRGQAVRPGLSGGRSPRTTIARSPTRSPGAASTCAFVIVDDGRVRRARRRGLAARRPALPHSCLRFGQGEILERLNAAAGAGRGITATGSGCRTRPTPRSTTSGSRTSAASTCSCSPPAPATGTSRSTRRAPRPRPAPTSSRCEPTRRDNLATFPSFGGLDVVPRHGVTVGVDTIREHSARGRDGGARRGQGAGRRAPRRGRPLRARLAGHRARRLRPAPTFSSTAPRRLDHGSTAPRLTQGDPTMARIKIAYLGGGSSRGAGTMASFLPHGKEFDGSEVVLHRPRPGPPGGRSRRSRRRWPGAQGLDITVTTTTDQRAGADRRRRRPVQLPARRLRAPARSTSASRCKHGVIGQETQGPGGMMMSLRSIHVIEEHRARTSPRSRRSAVIFNYTNPVNIVSQAVTDYTDRPIVSMCEGPIVLPAGRATAAGLDPDQARGDDGRRQPQLLVERGTPTTGEDLIPLLRERWEALQGRPRPSTCTAKRMLHLAVAMGSVPSDYFHYYYFREELLRELQWQPTTRAEDLLAALPGYWEHYAEQAAVRRARARPEPLARRHPRARARDRRDERLLQRHRRPAAGQPAQHRRRAARVRRDTSSSRCGARGRARASARVPQQPLPHAVRGITQAARGVPAPRRRGRPGRAPAPTPSARWPPTRWSRRCPSPRSSTTSWPSRTAPTCRSVCSRDARTTRRSISGSTPATPRPSPWRRASGEVRRRRARPAAATSTGRRAPAAAVDEVLGGDRRRRSPGAGGGPRRGLGRRSGWPASTGRRTRQFWDGHAARRQLPRAAAQYGPQRRLRGHPLRRAIRRRASRVAGRHGRGDRGPRVPRASCGTWAGGASTRWAHRPGQRGAQGGLPGGPGPGPGDRADPALLEFYGKPSAAELNHWFTRREGGARHQDRTSCRPRGHRGGRGRAIRWRRASSARRAGTWPCTRVWPRARPGLAAADGPVNVVLSGSVLMAPGSPVAAALLAELAGARAGRGAAPQRSAAGRGSGSWTRSPRTARR